MTPTVAFAFHWIPWTTTIWVACVMAAGAGMARRLRHASFGVLRELGIVLALYSLWGFAGEHSDLQMGGAESRGAWIWRASHWLPLPSELTVQRWVLPHEAFVRFLNVYYAVVHVPSLLAFLVWMFWRHRDAYARWRNVVALLTLACLAIQLVPVAPPRLTPGLGFVDTAARFGPSVYPHVGDAGPNQFSAMPSVHVAWASVVALAVVLVSRSRWRWVVVAHVATTFLAVVATGNHWWLDGLVAWVLLASAYAVELAARRSSAAVFAMLRRRAVALEPAVSAVET